MKLGPTEAETLQYLADLGWSELYVSLQAPAPQAPASSRQKAAPVASSRSGLPAVGVEKALGKEEAFGKEKAAYSPIVFSSPDRSAELVELEALSVTASTCRLCGLCETRSRVVFASGDPRARLMLIGEAPGAEEDKQGLPFVGRAGELLNKILEAIGLRREAVYVANVIKCRPPGNRDPQPEEMAACRSYLDAQIDLVQPDLLVALGRVPAQALLGTDASLTRLRGDWHEVRGIPLRVTYHPAALLRNAAYKRPTWEDMQLVRDRLQELSGAAAASAASAPAERATPAVESTAEGEGGK